MNKGLLWLTRASGLFGSFWFFYWAFVHEMVVWEKPSPDFLNLIFMASCITLCFIPNFNATKKPKMTELQKLQYKALHAFCPEQREDAKKKIIAYLKKQDKGT